MRSLTVTIPQPCPERWADMQPADRGRFCANCQKTVVDYTGYTDQELIRRLQKAPETACGRFRDEQLNRPLVQSALGVSVWRQWISLLTMGLFGWQTARGQADQVAKPVSPTSVRPVFSVSAIPLQKDVDPDAKLSIKGRVMLLDTNDQRSPMAGCNVSVFLVGKTWKTQADSSGWYSLAIPVLVQEGPVPIPVELSISASVPGCIPAGSTVSVKPTTTSVLVDELVLRQVRLIKNISGGGICLVRELSGWQKLKRKLFR